MTACSRLDEYLANRLSNGDALAFEEHLRTCETCRTIVMRQKAVERAAMVLKRNARTTNGVSRPSSAPTPVVPSHKAVTVETATIPGRTLFDSSNETRPRRRSGMPAKRFVLTVLAIMFAGGLFWALTHHRAALELADEPTPAVVPANVPTPVVAAAPKDAPAPAAPDLEPVVEAPPAQAIAPLAKTPPADTKTTATTAIPEPGPSGFFAVGTDIETLAQVVASKRCGQAVSALKARVVSNPNETRSWVLLTQCYAKRRRWKETVDAYDKVTKYGDKAAVASVQPEVDRARAAIEAEASAPPAVATPTPAE